MTALFQRNVSSPVGDLRLVATARALVGIYFAGHDPEPDLDAATASCHEVLDRAELELAEYFRGERRSFTVPLEFRGTPFQQAVWRALGAIPFGETRTYGELARQTSGPGAARAVGAANRVNPFSILVPCHRVIGASGELTGYAGGLDRKRWLLEHERRVVLTNSTSCRPSRDRLRAPCAAAARTQGRPSECNRPG